MTIIQALKQYSQEGVNGQRENIMLSMCCLRRILGYVHYMTDFKDQHGWQLLLQTEHIKDYIHLVRNSAGASPSTAKNYSDRMVTLLKLTDTHFFDKPGIPQDPEEVSPPSMREMSGA